MSLGTVICWTAWVFILFNIDPAQADFLSFIFFYSSLFLALLGTFSVIGFLFRRRVVKEDEIVFRHVKKTFRQGIMLATWVILFLFLQQSKLLTWWIATILIVLFVVIEGLIFANRKYNNRDYVG